MKNKTLQEQYNLIQEGKGNSATFLKDVKRQFPKLIRNAAGLTEAVDKLKAKSIISENYVDLKPIGAIESRAKETWETKFESFLKEEKAQDYKRDDWGNLDNQIGTEILRGIRFESEKSPEKNIGEIKKIVSKNLAKDSLYYMNNHLFGIEGLKPTQEEAQKTTGKFAGSGYSAKLTKLVKESLMNEFMAEELPTDGDMPMDEDTFSEDAEADAANDADSAMYDDNDYDGISADGKLEGEANEITSEVEEEIEKDTKGKKAKKETVQKTIQRIENIGSRQALEAKITAVEEEITKRNEQIGMIDENEAMAELMDKGKIKEMKKDIKMLEKQKMKYEKMCAKYDRK